MMNDKCEKCNEAGKVWSHTDPIKQGYGVMIPCDCQYPAEERCRLPQDSDFCWLIAEVERLRSALERAECDLITKHGTFVYMQNFEYIQTALQREGDLNVHRRIQD